MLSLSLSQLEAKNGKIKEDKEGAIILFVS
jgi:hypothetical protein